MIPEAAEKYIRKIRRDDKRIYATAFAAYMWDGAESPTRPASLSIMAAQSVHLDLHDIRLGRN